MDDIGFKNGRHQQLWLIPLDGETTRLTDEPVDVLSSCWSPDGTEIAFCANRRNDPDLSASAALWILTLASGQMRRLTPETGLAMMPSWSPDGQHIAYYYAEDQTEASNVSPWIVNARDGSAPRPATSGSRDVTCMEWLVDEEYSGLRYSAEWLLDLLGYFPSEVVGQKLREAVGLTDPRLKCFAAVSLLRRLEAVDPTEIERIAANNETRVIRS